MRQLDREKISHLFFYFPGIHTCPNYLDADIRITQQVTEIVKVSQGFYLVRVSEHLAEEMDVASHIIKWNKSLWTWKNLNLTKTYRNCIIIRTSLGRECHLLRLEQSLPQPNDIGSDVVSQSDVNPVTYTDGVKPLQML